LSDAAGLAATGLAPALDWRARIIAALRDHAGVAQPTASDDAEGATPDAAIIPAAVLVPIVLHPQPTLLLTLRTASLSAHAGQVSFPGGRIEPTDESAAGAALRETCEETGIAPAKVEVAGPLPRHLTGTGYAIDPVVGLLRPPLAPAPSAREVAELFELPLAVLLDPAAPRREERMFRGRMRSYWVIPHERHFIWGATAAILVNLGRVLRAAEA
jgi:8-oxo-dGTP pyrophosphatase MutT (NUDIX family)